MLYYVLFLKAGATIKLQTELFPACAKQKAWMLEKQREENMIYIVGEKPRAKRTQN